MNTRIRLLNNEDFPYFEAMETAIEEDYILGIFDKITSGKNKLYGLFIDNQLISMGGYSVFANHYAMLGRLRSDVRYRGKHYATELLTHVLNDAFHMQGIEWIGANTQEYNKPARRIVENLGFKPYTTLHGAVTQDIKVLDREAKPWNPIHSLERKKYWLKETYLKHSAVFPYECYYSFPASEALFQDQEVESWNFYENNEKTRFLITKYDYKRKHYLHVAYPWDDITSQEGLWETISQGYNKLLQEKGENSYIWMDLKKEAAQLLPTDHQFELPSPWILYGIDKSNMSQ